VERQKTVVVVDDEADIVESMTMFLRSSFPDVCVKPTQSPVEALSLARKGAELLVTDYRMPSMDGLELARRAQTANQGLPVILVTAFRDPSLQEEAESMGISVLSKPFQLDLLVGMVGDCLGL
jgi:CheY-like chemotaxis protein